MFNTVDKQTIVRLSPEAYKIAEEISNKTGRAIAQVVSDAVFKAYLGVEQALKDVVDKQVEDIKTETFKAKSSNLYCSICKKPIQQGELATVVTIIYSDKTMTKTFYCYECFLENTISDEQLLKLEKKKYELNRVVKILTKEKTKLLEEVDKLEVMKTLSDTLYRLNNILSYIDKENEVIDKLVEIEQQLREINGKLTTVKAVRPKQYARYR